MNPSVSYSNVSDEGVVRESVTPDVPPSAAAVSLGEYADADIVDVSALMQKMDMILEMVQHLTTRHQSVLEKRLDRVVELVEQELKHERAQTARLQQKLSQIDRVVDTEIKARIGGGSIDK